MKRSLVGRARELTEIANLLDGVSHGEGALVVISGEPGVGKTRLADAVVERARELGFQVGFARAWDSGGAPPFEPWIVALGQLGMTFPAAGSAPQLLDPARFSLFRDVADRLVAAAENGPQLIVFDDAHVADTSSLLLLQFLARELRHLRLLLLVTRRDADAQMTSDTYSLLARTAREGLTVNLERLSETTVRDWVKEAAPSQGPAFALAVWEASRGNPLFVSELLRLDPEGVMSGTIRLPATLREALRQMVEQAAPHELALLELAAAIGVEFELNTLCLASGQTPAVAVTTLEDLEAKGLVERVARSAFRFSHALVRQVIDSSLDARRSAQNHCLVASALLAQGNRAKVELAHHAILSSPQSHDTEEFVLAAVGELERIHAVEDSIKLLDEARLAARTQGAEPSVELTLALARLRLKAGDAQRGQELVFELLEGARRHEDRVLFARAVIALGEEFHPGRTDVQLRALLEEALANLPSAAIGERARLQSRLAAALQPSPRPDELAQRAHAAVELGRKAGDDRVLLEVIHWAASTWIDAVPSGNYLPILRDAVRLAQRLGDSERLSRAYVRVIFALLAQGSFDEADALTDTFAEFAASSYRTVYEWQSAQLESMKALRRGDLAVARSKADEATRWVLAGFDVGAAEQLVFHERALAMVEEERSARLALEPKIQAIVAHWNGSEHYSHFFEADLNYALGNLERARAALGTIPADSEVATIYVGTCGLAELTVALGDARLAPPLYERLVRSPDPWVIFGFSGFYVQGTLGRLLGGLSALMDRQSEAEHHLELALNLAKAKNVQPEVERIRRALERLRPESSRTIEDSCEREKSGTGGLVLRPRGETFDVAFSGQSTALKASLGLEYLGRLLRQPNQEIHVLDLVGSGRGQADFGDAGELLDLEARKAYKRRLQELDEEVAEAEGLGDPVRASRARSEIEFLATELSRAVDLRGRARRSGVAQERARVAVTRRLRAAVQRISEQLPAAGPHLERSLSTGIFCSYRPR